MPPVVRISPVGPSTSQTVSGLYTVEASHELPSIDASRTLKSVWLSPPTLRRYNALLHRCARPLTIVNMIANALLGMIVFYPAAIGRPITLVATPLLMPPTIAILLGLRYDMVALLLQNFDFWYQALTCCLCAVLFGASFQDTRAAAAIGVVAMFVLILLADANCRSQRYLFAVSVVATLMCIGISVFVAFGLVDSMHPFVVLRMHGSTLTAASVITHGYAIIIIVNIHNAYVRRQFATRRTRTATIMGNHAPMTTVRCVLYRCRLRWRERTSTGSRLDIQHRPVKTSFDVKHLQLRCHGLLQVMDARRTLVTRSTDSIPWLLRAELAVSGFVGFTSIIATFGAVANGYPPSSRLVQTLGGLSFALTTRVWLYFVCCVHQLDMLSILHSSFDFLFVFVQLVLAQLCLCDLCDWDARALAVIASLLWVHWALTVDAIPPFARELLRVPMHRVAIVIEALYLVGLLVSAIDLVTWETQRFHDRELVRVGVSRGTTSYAPHWSVGSFFLNRLVTLFAWLCRSIGRLVVYDPDELVVLRGVVEYDDYELHKRETRVVASRTQLQQITSALSQQSQRDGSDAMP